MNQVVVTLYRKVEGRYGSMSRMEYLCEKLYRPRLHNWCLEEGSSKCSNHVYMCLKGL